MIFKPCALGTIKGLVFVETCATSLPSLDAVQAESDPAANAALLTDNCLIKFLLLFVMVSNFYNYNGSKDTYFLEEKSGRLHIRMRGTSALGSGNASH